VPEACREVRRSVHEFGLPDVTGISVGTKEGRDMLRDTLQEALERFEPRLQGAVVRLVDVGDLGAPLVRFQVEGVLQMDPSPVRVVFDTMLEVSKGQYAVQEGAQSTTER
jgi:type VI secretion system protein ImpF